MKDDTNDSVVRLIVPDLMRPWFSRREAHSYKGDFGRVLIIAGSKGMMGAAVLCAHAALRSGAGLVTVSCPEEFHTVLFTSLPEAMCCGRQIDEWNLSVYDAVVIGPGLGCTRHTADLLKYVLLKSDAPVVADADALNAAAAYGISLAGNRGKWIVTPHAGEAARLLGYPREEFFKADQDRAASAKRIALTCDACCVLKGAKTLVCGRQSGLYENTTGNPGMATAGSGDVLSGIIAGVAAGFVRMSAWQDQDVDRTAAAAISGVYVHGLAGDIACAKLGERSMLSGDMVDALPQAFLSLEQQLFR